LHVKEALEIAISDGNVISTFPPLGMDVMS